MKTLARPTVHCWKTANQVLAILSHFALVAFTLNATAQTAPPAPTLTGPPNGAAIVQPITLDWGTVTDPDGPIGSYTWQVGTSSTFSTIIASGFQDMISDSIPTPTQDRVSGLPNGTYFWRVKATALVGGAVGSIDSTWSQVRSFTVTGLGPAPGTPSFTAPASPSSFHTREFFDITWTSVPGANYYLLEVDDDPAFSYPLTLTTDPIQFGTRFHAGWGNPIANIYYRVRAVSADNVRGLPSPTLIVHVVNTAPVPPAPTPLSPVGGTSITVPARFDWSDTPNPQIPGYDVDIDNNPNFSGAVGVLFAQGVSRSDYLVLPDPAVENTNIFPPGQYFWRVRALHGDVTGPWSSTATFNVVASPATPPGLEVFSIVVEPSSVSGGNPTQARVVLNMPAGPGGALVNVAPDLPNVQTPRTVQVPEGETDALVSPITTSPVGGANVGTVIAAYGLVWQQNSLASFPILWGLSLNAEGVIGGNSVTGTLTLLNPAPTGGVGVTLISSDTSLAAPPAKVTIPAGATGAAFSIPTAPVSVPIRVVFSSGTAFEGYRAPDTWLTLLPAGSADPAPSLASLILANTAILGGTTTTATVTLTDPAPAGGALVRLSGSMEGQVVTPQNVTVPAGSTTAAFTITAPQVNQPHFVLIQGTYGTSGGTQAQLLEIDPNPSGTPTLFALGVKPSSVIGGNSLVGTVQFVMPAPAGGALVALSSDNTAAQVPATVAIPAGNSADSFTITTTPVSQATSANITASAGGVTKSFFINIGPDPNAPPLLQSVSVSPTSVPGGTSTTGTVLLSSAAPAGGASVTLATSSSAAQAPGVVNVPAGQTSASFTITAVVVQSSTLVSVTAFLGSASQSASFTVTAGSQPPAPTLSSLSLSPTSVVGGSSSQATVALSSAAPSGGALVTLSSVNTSVATVPASVTIGAGATSAKFTVSSHTVASATQVTISASYTGVTKTAILTVNPVNSGVLPAPNLVSPAADSTFAPGANITFDWSDVAGAANYTIQIDDSSSFPSPWIVNQTVTASQFRTSTLPTLRMWWRARANDASGNPGTWSSARRFEVKN